MRKSIKHISEYLLVLIFLFGFSNHLLAQYEENDAYLVVTGMKLNENPLTYIKDPSYGKNAVVKIMKKGGTSSELTTKEFSVKKDGLTYYTADFKIPLDTEYSIEIRLSDGSVITIPDYKLLSTWKTHFYFHSTDGTLSPSCILRSQNGIDQDLRLCVFAVYPYSNYINLGGKQTFTDVKTLNENKFNLLVFPNPATNQAQLTFNLTTPEQINVTLKTFSGTVLACYSGLYTQGENRIELIKGKKLPAGLYFVHVNAGEQEFVKKLLVF